MVEASFLSKVDRAILLAITYLYKHKNLVVEAANFLISLQTLHAKASKRVLAFMQAHLDLIKQKFKDIVKVLYFFAYWAIRILKACSLADEVEAKVAIA